MSGTNVMGFTYLDVQAIVPSMSDDAAEIALWSVSENFKDRLTEVGSEILSDLLQIEEEDKMSSTKYRVKVIVPIAVYVDLTADNEMDAAHWAKNRASVLWVGGEVCGDMVVSEVESDTDEENTDV